MKISKELKDLILDLVSLINVDVDLDESKLFELSRKITQELPNPVLYQRLCLLDLLNLPFHKDFALYKQFYTTTTIDELYKYSPQSMSMILSCLIQTEMSFLTFKQVVDNKNMEKITNLFNFISRLVEHSLLLNKNAKLFLFWEKVCHYLLMSKNLYGLKAVATGLTSVITSRTFEEKDYSDELKVLIEYTIEDDNYSKFRKLHQHQCLPYLGMLRRDYIYCVDASNKNSKDSRLVDLENQFQSFDIYSYPSWESHELLEEDMTVLSIILSYEKINDDDIYQLTKKYTLMDKIKTNSRPNSKLGSPQTHSPRHSHHKSHSETVISAASIHRISMKTLNKREHSSSTSHDQIP